MNILDPSAPPTGFKRASKKGWIVSKPSPSNAKINALKESHKQLHTQVQQLQEVIAKLTENVVTPDLVNTDSIKKKA
jgi:hypothetical protein